MTAFITTVRKTEGTLIGIQGSLELAHRPVNLIPFHIKIAQELVHPRISRTPGVNRCHRFEGIIYHFEPVIKSPEKKLYHGVLRIF